MPRLSIFLGLFLCSVAAMGQKTAADYTKEIDALYLNKDFKPALQLATKWESEAKEKFGEHSLEHAIPLAQYARALFEVTQDYPTADSLFQVSLQWMKDANAAKTNEFAEALRWAGISKLRQGAFPDAIALIESAMDIQTALFGTDHMYTMGSQANLINANVYLGRYTTAEKLCQTGIEALERLNKANTHLYQYYLMAYGGLLANQHQFSKAIAFQEKGIALGKKLYGAKHPTYHTGLFELARTYHMAQRLEEAEALFLLVIKLSDKQPKYLSYQALGIMQTSMGLFEEAEQNLQHYSDYLERTGGGNPLNFAATLATLSGIHAELGHFFKTDSLQLEAMDIYSKILGDTSVPYLEVLLLRANTITNHDDLEKAQAFLNDISIRYTKQIEADPYLFGTFLQIRGRLAFRLGAFQQADELFAQSLALNGADSLEGLRLRAFSLFYLNNLPELESTIKALVATCSAEAQANFTFLSDSERQQLYSKLVMVRDVLANLKQQKPDLDLEASLFDFQIFTKNILEYTTRKTQSYVQNADDPSLSTLYKAWKEAHEQLNFAYQISPEEVQNAGLDLKTLEDKAESLEKEILRRGVPVIQNDKTPVWTDIRNRLKPGEAAIDVIRFQRLEWETYQDTVIYAFSILKPGAVKPELVFLNNGIDLESFVIGQYQNEITRKKDLSPNLFEKMWAPISAHLQGIKTVYFSPDGIFHKINLNTLRAADGTYLLDNIEIKQVTNLRHLLRIGAETSGSEPGTAALFGNPAFKIGAVSTPSDTTFDLTARTSLYRDIAEDSKGDLHLPLLPGSEREVRAIAQKLTDKKWKTVLFTGAQATEDALKQIKSPKVLHIATHGYFLNSEKNSSINGHIAPYAGKHPALRSMLFLAGAENSITGKNTARNDGILTAFEASVLNLDQTDLVVLSACNTGLGKILNGEGVFGLQRAFRIAGAKSLIMSLWDVEDAATELLMNTFYENWLSGMSKSEAFRKAQLSLRVKYPQPFYWGSFILVDG